MRGAKPDRAPCAAISLPAGNGPSKFVDNQGRAMPWGRLGHLPACGSPGNRAVLYLGIHERLHVCLRGSCPWRLSANGPRLSRMAQAPMVVQRPTIKRKRAYRSFQHSAAGRRESGNSRMPRRLPWQPQEVQRSGQSVGTGTDCHRRGIPFRVPSDEERSAEPLKHRYRQRTAIYGVRSSPSGNGRTASTSSSSRTSFVAP